jgi:Beta-fructosidases (levanase/invertase)
LNSLLSFAQNLEIAHLSDSQTLVRVSGKDRYVLLPVQETAPEASLKVLADATLQQTIDVRLATDQVDYYVPLDLSAWAGKNILLDITMTQGRGFRRDPSDDVCWEEMKTSAVFDTANREAFRPAYHFSPAYGWMNDPNGMVYKDGLWHLFFQYNPYGSVWGNMTWGHAVTKDLVHWEQWDNAIVPNALGAVFSGSAVVDKENVSGFGHDAIVAMYTSAGASQTQSLAWSNDGGKTFQVYGKNPVITGDVPDFRDPKMFYDGQTRQWKVVLAAGQEVQFWSSDNLKDWTYESSFGQTYGNHNGVWECPDLVQIDGKWVLLLNINPRRSFRRQRDTVFRGLLGWSPLHL